MKYELINSIKNESESAKALFENCTAAPIDILIILESADKLIGNVIAALKAGKNPFETIPGSKEQIVGLMLLANETNREALNVNDKKFDLISQKASDSKAVQKFVAQIAQSNGPSRIKNIEAYVTDDTKREVLAKKLVKLQNVYSTVKHKARTVMNFHE